MNKKGFTLIELAMVLVIIGLLAGIGITALGILVKRAKINTTKEIINAAADSLISYSGSSLRLPANDNEFKSVVRTPVDPFGKKIKFFVDQDLISNSKLVCRKKNTNLTVRICEDTACSSPIDVKNVAFLLVSGSLNNNIQTGDGNNYTQDHTIPLSSPTTIYVYDYGINGIDNFPSDMNRPERYDDIVKWITLGELQTKIRCENRLSILNNELPYGYENSSYNATVFAEGGITFPDGTDADTDPDYKWCYQGNLPSGISISCGGTLSVSTNCLNTDGSVNTGADWNQCSSPVLTGTIGSGQTGSYNIRFFVTDSEGNLAEKSLVLTVNPQTSSSGQSAPPGSQVSFANDLGNFSQVENNPDAVNPDQNNGIVTFGNGQNNTYGCFWYNGVFTLKNKTMRAFFYFKLSVDTSSDSRGDADGFTFVIRQEPPWNFNCGGPGGKIGYDGLDKESIAVEIDTYPNTSWSTPNENYLDPYSGIIFRRGLNHVSIDFNGSVTHTGSTTASARVTSDCTDFSDPTKPGCYYTQTPTWLEDGVRHSFRMEIHTQCNNSCSRCGLRRGTKMLIEAWIDCTNCDDLTTDYNSSSPDVKRCVNWTNNLTNVKFGFTEGTGGRTQTVEISYFGIRFE